MVPHGPRTGISFTRRFFIKSLERGAMECGGIKTGLNRRMKVS